MGKRGMHHATAFNANPKFQVAGICDIDPKRLDDAAAKLGNPQKGTDAAALAKAVKPDVFCFCTLPQPAHAHDQGGDCQGGAKLIAFEKPVALTSAELFTIRDLLNSAGAKAVVSHQHRYGTHYQKVKEIIASGALGRVHTVYGSATGWMTHMLSHLIDYTCWFNNYTPASWAMAQAAGRAKLGDNHPSPDYIGGFVQFANGVRGIYECGAGAPDQPEVAKWWGKNRIGAQGTEGFAEVLTNGGWRAVTKIGRLPERRRRDELRPRHAALHPGNGRLAGQPAEAAPVQFRARLPGRRDHAGHAAQRRRRRPGRPAAH